MVGIFDKLAKYGIGQRQMVSRGELAGIIRCMWDVVVMHNDIEDPTERLAAIQSGWLAVSSRCGG